MAAAIHTKYNILKGILISGPSFIAVNNCTQHVCLMSQYINVLSHLPPNQHHSVSMPPTLGYLNWVIFEGGSVYSLSFSPSERYTEVLY